MAKPKHLKYIVLTYELLTSGLSDKEQKVLGNIIGVVQGGGRYRFDNHWIADFLCTHPNSASRIISSLQSKGLVEVTLIKKEGTNAIAHRTISLTERCINTYVDTPLNTSVDTPLNTSVNHNNKEYNIKDNNIFVRFWDLYDYKVRKKDTLKAWNKIDPKYHNKILTHVKNFVKHNFTDPNLFPSRPHPATYLNGERWNDEIATSMPTKKSKLNGKDVFIPIIREIQRVGSYKQPEFSDEEVDAKKVVRMIGWGRCCSLNEYDLKQEIGNKMSIVQ